MADDPNEAYAVHPITEGWMTGGWTVTKNGEPWRHFAQTDRTNADRYATDPAYRAELAARETKLHERPVQPAPK